MSTNTYKNEKKILRGKTSIHTAPTTGVSLIKSIHITNNDENTDSVVTIIITDTNSNEFIYERNRDVPRGSTIEILQPSNDSFDSSLLILNSSEVLKATTTGSNIHLVSSILEMK